MNVPAESNRRLIRVALLDDHEIVRHGVSELVNAEGDMAVVGQASSSAELLRIVKACEPDVAVLDVRLSAGSGDGISTCRDITSAHPDTKCLMLTSFSDDQALVSASLAGAAGFVLKQIRGNDLIESIRKVASGSQLLDDAAVRLAMQRLRATEAGALDTLTDQERRVFDLIGEGLSNRQIGEQLFIAEKTVKNYVSNVLAKLGMVRRTEAAALAARLEERERTKYD